MSSNIRLTFLHKLWWPVNPTRPYKLALCIAFSAAVVDALNVAYNYGYLACSDSASYLACLGIMSRHGSYLQYVNSMRLEITVGVSVCAIGLMLKRKVGVLLSLGALVCVVTIYALWYRRTLADMRELEVPNFGQLQGSDFQHLIPLRYANWLDVIILVVCGCLLVWLISVVIRVLRTHKDTRA